MKRMRNRYDKLITLALSLGSILVIHNAQKWQEPFLYILAITLTLYSYVLAIGLTFSFCVYAIWSIIYNIRLVARLKIENMEMIRSLTETMNEIAYSKNLSTVK